MKLTQNPPRDHLLLFLGASLWASFSCGGETRDESQLTKAPRVGVLLLPMDAGTVHSPGSVHFSAGSCVLLDLELELQGLTHHTGGTSVGDMFREKRQVCLEGG